MSETIVPLGPTSTPGSAVPVQTPSGGVGQGQVGPGGSVNYGGKTYWP